MDTGQCLGTVPSLGQGQAFDRHCDSDPFKACTGSWEESGFWPAHRSCGQELESRLTHLASPQQVPPSLLLTGSWPKLMAWEWTLQELKPGSGAFG